MKISSSTHLTILVSFAVVFVGLYLYYTINDVRRMAVDIKKITIELNSLSSTVVSITKELTDIQKSNMEYVNMNDMLSKELNGILKCDTNNATCALPKVSITSQNEDARSVDTVDIKKLINDDDEDNESSDEQLNGEAEYEDDDEEDDLVKVSSVAENAKE